VQRDIGLTFIVKTGEHRSAFGRVRGKSSVDMVYKKGKGSQYSVAERTVARLIPVLGSQPAGDVSHKPGDKTVTRQRRGCDLNPGLLRLSPAR